MTFPALSRLLERAREPRDIASLAAYRVLFGALMAVALVRFWAKGWIDSQLLSPSFHFTYPGFSFVRPPEGPWLYFVFALLVLSALGIALGYFYRVSAALFCLGFTYAELIDQANYLNHYYLVSLLSFLLALVPAHHAFSLDVRLRRAKAAATVPAFVLWALRAQVGVVYVFAGVAKLNSDWLLEAQPLRIWLAARGEVPWLGSLLGTQAAAYAAAWSSAAYDLTVVWFLLRPRTRPYAFFAVILFHTATGLLFPIGMFPWIMTAAATLFFAPGWPRALPWVSKAASPPRDAGADVKPWLLPLLLLHTLLQILVPLCFHLVPRESAWSGRGFNFAWKVMAAEKAGSVHFEIEDPVRGERRILRPRGYLTHSQEHAMAQDPHMIRTFALHIAEDIRRREGRKVRVFAHAFATLNGRPSARLLDPEVDLTGELPAGWILPAPRR